MPRTFDVEVTTSADTTHAPLQNCADLGRALKVATNWLGGATKEVTVYRLNGAAGRETVAVLTLPR